MDLSAEEVVKGLLSDEAYETPPDTCKVEDIVMKLPDWYDEVKVKQGRRFFWDFCLSHTLSLIFGFIAVLAVPSVIKVFVGSQRSNTDYTAYRRYLSTYLHILAWFSTDFEPGSTAWRSLHTVRVRHIQAGKAARLKKQGKISQRDMSLTMLGLIGFTVTSPDKFHIAQQRKGDMEALIHVWGVVGSMIGCEDRYNICRKTYDETRQVCQALFERVLTPSLENVPEYFEHTTRALIIGGSAIVPCVDPDFFLYWTKYLSNIPGYIYTEEDRFALQRKLRDIQAGSDDKGVDSKQLIQKCQLAAPAAAPTASRLLYVRDYETVAGSPAYTNLPTRSKFNMALLYVVMSIYSTFIGRTIFNFYLHIIIFLAKHFPVLAIWRYGYFNAFADMFKEDPKDETPPKTNSEYYKKN